MSSMLELNRTLQQNLRLKPKDKENCVAERCWETEKLRNSYESDVLNALNRQETDLLFWRNEIEHNIDRLSEERRQLKQFDGSLEYYSNFQNGLLHSVKRCQNMRHYQAGARNIISGDDTHGALHQESLLLSRNLDQIGDMKRNAETFINHCHSMELSLIEELKMKMSSLEASKKSESLCFVEDKETDLDNNVENRTLGEPTQWQEDVERRLTRCKDLLNQSQSFRNSAKAVLFQSTAHVTSALCRTAGLLRQDEETAAATKDRAMILMEQINSDLVLTRERNTMLLTEIGKQRRHVQAVVSRMHLFRLKPGSEQILDEPLSEMQSQIEKTKIHLSSLEKCHEAGIKKEKELILTQRNLRQSLEKASRTVFLYKDEVKGQRRVGSDLASLVLFQGRG